MQLGFSLSLVKGGSAIALWDPTELGSALQLWLKGDSLSGNDGDAISTWTDSSGNSRNATQGVGADQPNLEVAELDGKNVVRFDKSNTEHLDLTNFMTGFSAGTVVYVFKATSDPAVSTNAGTVLYSGSAGQDSHLPSTDSNIYDAFGSTARKTVGNLATSLTNWGIGCSRSAASDWKYFLNGTQEFTTGTNTVGWTTTPKVGHGGTATNPRFDGMIAEIVMTNTAVSSGERERLEGYLAHKWGIESVLPAQHPYKTSAPTV